MVPILKLPHCMVMVLALATKEDIVSNKIIHRFIFTNK